ncbi:hypothetical protein [Lacibacter sediminis]|uniref:Outer membrane lipoprotein-sorting protein n=1 Tax=Lacibacter sediminis TaxID=2760713 RepID=A0A7G5XB87_9BACT|nr:hypothetical protein [Lacibacter sediminis]QNA42740.1 hypothetical protein H4075_11570 [Lacibacter sediminis]
MQKLFTLLCVSFVFVASAQQLTPAELKQFKLREDSLKRFGYEIVRGTDAAVRFRSDSNFTRILVRALIQDKSYQFPFDSLKTISKVYSPDSSFRIFTWQVVRDDDYCRQKGFIQLRSPKGKEKFIPLRDADQFIANDVDTVANNMWWVGAVYYRILEKEHNGRKYYTLFGYDENDARTTKKWLDVMWFDDNGTPMFGIPSAFSYAKDSVPKPALNRFLLEYKKDGRARVQYDEELDMIIFDHLISETNEPGKRYTLIPDGDYEGFKWTNGQWLHIDKVFDFKLKDGEAPIPEAIDFNNRLKMGEGMEVPATTKPAPKKPTTTKPAAKPPVKKKTGG